MKYSHLVIIPIELAYFMSLMDPLSSRIHSSLEFYSYKEVLESVREETVFAALINKNIASYLSEQDMHGLVMLKTIDVTVPVSTLWMASDEAYFGSMKDAMNNLTCYSNYQQNIITDAELEYQLLINVSGTKFYKID